MTSAQIPLSEIDDKAIDFLEYLEIEKGSSPLTLRNYRHYLKRFSGYLKDQGIRQNLDDINTETVRQFRVYLSRLPAGKGETLSRKTQGYHVIALRSFLKWLIKNDYQVMAPDKIDLPKIAERQVKFLSGEQVDRLLNAPGLTKITGKRDKAILETFFSTGLRVSELVSLSRDKVDLDRREFGIVGKGGKARVVFLSTRAAEWIRRYLDAREDKYLPLFIRHKGKVDPTTDAEGMRLTPRSVQRMIKKYVKKVKLPVDATPHILRHCLHPDTRIFTPGFGMSSARDLYFSQSSSVIGVNLIKGTCINAQIVGRENHIASLYSIWADGYELICSPNHRLFTISHNGISEVCAKELLPGDYVMAVKQVDYKGTSFVKPSLARLLGYIAGDGVVSSARRGVIISDKDKTNLLFYQHIIEDELGGKSKIRKDPRSASYNLVYYSDQFVKFATELGLNVAAKHLRVPPRILNSPLEEILHFMAGVYDAEGNSNGAPRFFSSSKDFLKDIQYAGQQYLHDRDIS